MKQPTILNNRRQTKITTVLHERLKAQLSLTLVGITITYTTIPNW